MAVAPNSPDAILGAIIRHWRVAVSVAAAMMILALLFSIAQPKRYRAEAIGAVGVLPQAMTTSETLHGVDTLDRRVVVASLAALAPTPAMRARVHAQEADRIEAAVLPSTSLLQVTAEGNDPVRIAALANAVVPALDADARAIYAVYGVVPVSPASAPAKPSAPQPARAAFGGLIVGALAGAAAAYVLERRSGT